MVGQDEQTNDLLRRLSEFRSSASDAHTAWVNQAALYVNEGFINKDILDEEKLLSMVVKEG